MRNKIIAGVVAVVVIVAWIFWGRFAVEGGKVPWAIINGRNDVLKEALAGNPAESEKEEGLWRAVHKNNSEAIPLLLKAGVDPNKVRIGDNCLLEYPTSSFTVIRALVEGGADPDKCRTKRDDFARHIVAQFGGSISEPELISFLQLLAKQGYRMGPDVLAAAEKSKQEKVAAYLRNPTGANAGKVQKLALLGGETEVERDDLKKVCKGEGVANATAYKRDPELLSPAYLFEVRKDEPYDDTRILPRWWIADRLQHTQVVGCAIVIDKRVVKECKYEGGVSIKYYSASYELSVREARTADQISHKQVSVEAEPPETCPMFKMGGTEGVYPNYGPEMIALLKDAVGAKD